MVKLVISVHVAIITCFTVIESFNNARKWLTELRDHSDSNIVVLLAGNKNDLSHLRAVSVEQAHEFANSEGKIKFRVHHILSQVAVPRLDNNRNLSSELVKRRTSFH